MKKHLKIFILGVFLTLPLHAAQPYILKPKDTIEIKVINHNEFTIKQEITPDLTLSVPLIGRISVENKTLNDLDQTLKTELSKYIQNLQLVVLLTPQKDTPPATSIFVTLFDQNKQTWEVKKTESVAEALAYTGNQPFTLQRGTQMLSPTTNLLSGDILTVKTGKEPDFWGDNWYKLLSAASVVLGIYNVLH